MESFGPRLRAVVPAGVYLDVWPLPPTHEMIPAIRDAGREIFRRPSTMVAVLEVKMLLVYQVRASWDQTIRS